MTFCTLAGKKALRWKKTRYSPASSDHLTWHITRCLLNSGSTTELHKIPTKWPCLQANVTEMTSSCDTESTFHNARIVFKSLSRVTHFFLPDILSVSFCQ